MSFYCATCDDSYGQSDVIGMTCSICGSGVIRTISSSSASAASSSGLPSLPHVTGGLNALPAQLNGLLSQMVDVNVLNNTDNASQATETIPQPFQFDEESTLEGIEAILGAEWRESLLQMFAGGLLGDRNQSQKLSPAVADSLGVLTVDNQGYVLRDVTLHVGPLTVSCMPATFSWMPVSINTLELEAANLQCLKNDLWTENICESSLSDTFVVSKRGRVTFAKKAINCIGCRGLLISQPKEYKWPFQATDSAHEHALLHANKSATSDFPVLTVRESDIDVVLQYLEKVAERPPVRLRFGEAEKDCSICQEQFSTGDKVLKLPCRHIFHDECVRGWLQTKTTCPLCRSGLPDKAQEEARRRQEIQRDAEHTMYS